MALQENEEKGEEEAEVVVLVGDEAKWGGEWRTSVMAGNEKGLYLQYNKRNPLRLF